MTEKEYLTKHFNGAIWAKQEWLARERALGVKDKAQLSEVDKETKTLVQARRILGV